MESTPNSITFAVNRDIDEMDAANGEILFASDKVRFNVGLNAIWFGEDTLATILSNAGQGEINAINTVKVNGTALVPDGDRAVDITIPAPGDANVIETIKVNGSALSPSNKTVEISVPSVPDNIVQWYDQNKSTIVVGPVASAGSSSLVLGNALGNGSVGNNSIVVGAGNNVGNLGFAYGTFNTVEGFGWAFGNNNTAGYGSIVFGNTNNTGHAAFVYGGGNTAGHSATVFGETNTVGVQSTVMSGWKCNVGNVSFSWGSYNNIGDYSIAMGASCFADPTAPLSTVVGYGAASTNAGAFVWNSQALEVNPPTNPLYYSHGLGTFNINPVGGPYGVWIGNDNLATLMGMAVQATPPQAHTHTKSQITDFAHTHTPAEVGITALYDIPGAEVAATNAIQRINDAQNISEIKSALTDFLGNFKKPVAP